MSDAETIQAMIIKTMPVPVAISPDALKQFEALCADYDTNAADELGYMILAKVNHWRRYKRNASSGTNPFRTQRNYNDRCGV